MATAAAAIFSRLSGDVLDIRTLYY
jgi:hypothetical protein